MIQALEKLIHKKPNNFIIICFNDGMGGSSLLRILTGHDEIYHSKKNLLQLDYDDPLRYPDSTEGFYIHPVHRLSFKEQHLACAHTSFHTPWEGSNTEDLRLYFKLVKENKIIVLKTHQFIADKFPKTKFIYIIGKALDRGISINMTEEKYSKSNNIYYLEISKLFSYDYNTYLDQYIKLVNYFNLTPRVNSVRAFILMWLERQERFKRSLS